MFRTILKVATMAATLLSVGTGCAYRVQAIYTEVDVPGDTVYLPGTETVTHEVIVETEEIPVDLELVASGGGCTENTLCYQSSFDNRLEHPTIEADPNEILMAEIQLMPDHRYLDDFFWATPTSYPLRCSVSVSDDTFHLGCDTESGQTVCLNQMLTGCIGVTLDLDQREIGDYMAFGTDGYYQLVFNDAIDPLIYDPVGVGLVCFPTPNWNPSWKVSCQPAANYAGTGEIQFEGGLEAPGLRTNGWYPYTGDELPEDPNDPENQTPYGVSILPVDNPAQPSGWHQSDGHHARPL